MSSVLPLPAPQRRTFLPLVFAAGCLGIGCSGSSTQDVLSSSTSSTSSSSSSSGSTGALPANCPKESEPNDTEGQANTLSPELCGTLSSKDSVDFLTFTLQPKTKTMSINFTGRVKLRVEVSGKDAVELTPDNAGIVPFVMGEPYTIQVTPQSSSGSSDITWRVAVVEK